MSITPTAPAIQLPDDDQDTLRRIMAIPAPTQQPKAVSTQGIPVTPQTPNHAIPVNRATGAPEELNNEGKAIAPGVAGLWTRAENIHNPILRTLGKIGAVGARAIDVAGSVAAPGIAAQIPGSTLNQKIGENRAEKQQTADEENAERQAVTAHTKEETAEMPAKANLENAEAQKALNGTPKKPEDLNQQYADAVADAVKRGDNPLQDQKVQQFADAITQIQKQPQEKTPNDFEQFYGDWIKDNNFPDTAHNRVLARKQWAAANQAPQRPPQITMVVPGQNGGPGTLETLRPGQAVPTGSMSPTQYGPAQQKQQDAQKNAGATLNAFTRYQKSFEALRPKLSQNDIEALQVLTSHSDAIAHNLIEANVGGVIDAVSGHLDTGYTPKLMQGAMTKDQYDKLSPEGKKMLADYSHAIVANFVNMKQRMGTAGSRNQAMVQAEMNNIPFPYVDQESANALLGDTMEDIRSYSGIQAQPSSGRRVIDLTK